MDSRLVTALYGLPPQFDVSGEGMQWLTFFHQILFLNDPNPVKKLQSQFATYAQHFPGWATQSNAMAQYHLWTALEAEGCACNLQHYNPIVSQSLI